jgi:radical SAM superfamily enzyme YgiQ (UPF0313 family)
MDVCLFSPPVITEFEDPELAGSPEVRSVAEHKPIGVLTLAAVLRQKGLTPRLIDLNRWYYEYLGSGGASGNGCDFCAYAARRLDPFACDVFGFSTICSSYPLTLRLAAEVRRTHPKAAIILGGPQASAVDVPTLKAFDCVDIIVRGEAEESFPRVLESVHSRTLDLIAGVTFRRGSSIVRTPNAPLILDLDALPLPAFDLYPEMKECRFVPLELGRGCPFACTFCSTNDFFGRKFRLKSPGKVIEQMRQVKQAYNVGEFVLIHDMFTVDRKRIVAFCEALLDAGEEFLWYCSARTDCVDDELIALTARAGCRGLFFGIETGSPSLQKAIGKCLDLEEARGRIGCADRHGIGMAVSLITAFPEETQGDLEDTVDFLADSLRYDHSEPQLTLLAPLAGTPIHAQYRERLEFDDIFSDMSYQGWRQDPADRELIAKFADVFVNFYAVPTPLDRKRLKELRAFVRYGIRRFRWLLLALHQECDGLLKVFDEWGAWRGQAFTDEGCELYYRTPEFRDDFLRFVRERYLDGGQAPRPAVSAVLAFLEAWRRRREGATCAAVGNTAPPAGDAIPHLAEGVQVVELGFDFTTVLRYLRENRRVTALPEQPVVLASRRGANGRSELLRLSPHSAELLRLCDGARPVRAIAAEFASRGEIVAGVPPETACLFGLDVLRQQGLISFAPPASAARATTGGGADVGVAVKG